MSASEPDVVLTECNDKSQRISLGHTYQTGSST
jgi:hypothetical protein